MAAAEEVALSVAFFSSGTAHDIVLDQQLWMLGVCSELPCQTASRQDWLSSWAGSRRTALLQHWVLGLLLCQLHSGGRLGVGDVCYLGCRAQTSLSVIRSIRSFLKNTQKLKTLLQKCVISMLCRTGSLSWSQRSYIDTLLNSLLILELL